MSAEKILASARIDENKTAASASPGNGWSASRRAFLRVLGYGAGAAMTGSAMASAAATPSSVLLQDDAFWARVQDMFVLNPNKTFMNIGTGGSMPRVALDVFNQENHLKAMESASGYGTLADLRARVAPGFGVDADELAFSGNASSGMCHAILGLDWQAGDVIVTTNHEHSGGNIPLAIAADRYGIEISRVKLPVGNAQSAATYVELFDSRIRQLRARGKRVRAVMWSAPSYKTGTMLPIAELMEVVKKHELISIVDGAHLPGMMAYDYAALGMDFMAGAGHKWQCGPSSTGILVIRNKLRASNPLPLPKWYPIHTNVYSRQARGDSGAASIDIAASATSCGSLHTPMFKSLVRACEMWDGIGRKKIETYDLALSAYLKERIVERWGVGALYSPKDDPKLVSAMTSFNPFRTPADIMDGRKAEQFVGRMQSDFAPGFVLRKVDFAVVGAPANHHGIRISTHVWHDASDIDRLVESMWALSEKMA